MPGIIDSLFHGKEGRDTTGVRRHRRHRAPVGQKSRQTDGSPGRQIFREVVKRGMARYEYPPGVPGKKAGRNGSKKHMRHQID